MFKKRIYLYAIKFWSSIIFNIFHKEKLINEKDNIVVQTKQAYQACLDKYFKIMKK